MSSRSLPRDVAAFLREHVHSVEQLEVLLAVRATPARSWTAAELARELRTSETSVAARLRDLLASGLVARSEAGGHTYAPTTPELDAAVSAVTASYAEMRFRVIEAILSRPVDKVRLFANAFRLRRAADEEEDDDG